MTKLLPLIRWIMFLYLKSGLARRWYKIYQFVWERGKKSELRRFAALGDMVKYMRDMKWRADSWRELGDAINSPEAVQWKADNVPGHFIGDCLPVDTKVLREGLFGAMEEVRLLDLKVGDNIAADHRRIGPTVEVTAIIHKGLLPTLKFVLDNGRELFCTAEHRLILAPRWWERLFGGTGKELMACFVRVGDRLLGPKNPKVLFWGPGSVLSVMDITVEGGRFYLPDSGIIVHNCDEFGVYQAAVVNNELADQPQWSSMGLTGASLLTVMWCKTGDEVGRFGGLNGHNVCLLTYDDGQFAYMDYGWPSKKRATIQEVADDVRTRYAGTFLPIGWAVSNPRSLKVLRAERS